MHMTISIHYRQISCKMAVYIKDVMIMYVK